MNNIRWKQLNQANVEHGYTVSSNGIVVFNNEVTPIYHANNGHDYGVFRPFLNSTNNNRLVVLELGFIVATEFIPIPKSLQDKPLIVRHIDNDNRNNDVSNLQWCEDIECWRLIDSDDIESSGYYVSNWGRIRTPSGFVTNGANRCGYKYLTLRDITHHRKAFPIHRLVAEYFTPNDSIYRIYVNHIDGNPSNNHYMNLEFVTPGENHAHAIRTGLTSRFSTFDNVARVQRLLIQYDGSPATVVRHLHMLGDTSVSETIVQNIKNKMVQNGYAFRIRYTKKLTPEISDVIRDLLIDTNGNVRAVYEKIHTDFPNITISNIGTIRALMVKDGHLFTNWKRNRKITEHQRAELLYMLREYQSVSKVYNIIKDDPNFSNVTIYDIKYLRRKYTLRQ